MFALIYAILVGFYHPVLAQTSDSVSEVGGGSGEELDIVELELEKSNPRKKNPPVVPSQNPVQPIESSGLSNLSYIQSFEEVSILEKKFFPKTGRIQLAADIAFVTNDAFFNTYGAGINLGYFFTELLGVEFDFTTLTSSPAKATQELQSIQNIQTDSLVYPKSYMGLNLVIVPIYGKMSWFNQRIIQYDLFLKLGYGQTATQAENAGTYHFGIGQLFGLTKRTAFRWEFGWNSFSAKDINGSQGNFNNLLITTGFSFFFPEARYR